MSRIAWEGAQSAVLTLLRSLSQLNRQQIMLTGDNVAPSIGALIRADLLLAQTQLIKVIDWLIMIGRQLVVIY